MTRIIAAGVFVLSAVFTPVYADHAIDINTATLEELDTLPGVGATIAQRIVDGRPYASASEISTVQGIGEPGSKTYDDIIPHITAGAGGAAQNQNSGQETKESGASGTSSGGVFIKDTKEISVRIDASSTVFVGADSVFEAHVIGAVDAPIENARVLWSFGNGDRREGQNVLYNFAYPGTYVVVADASNGVYGAASRITVTAIPALIGVSDVTPEYIALTNRSGVEIDIGGWFLFSAGRQFRFPQSTIILDGETVFVSNKRTGLSGSDPGTVALQYPNGLVAAAYEYPLFLSRSASSGAQPAAAQAAAGAPETSNASGEVLNNASLITAPVVAVGGGSFSVPPLLWWILTLLMFAVFSSAGAVLVRREGRREYAVREIHE